MILKTLYIILALSFSFNFLENWSANNKEEEISPLLGIEIKGKASYYGPKFHGKTTANGEKMNKYDFTCAHKTLPFGTMIEVKNPENNETVLVRVNDRGPFVKGRVIDLSSAAAEKLKMKSRGIINVVGTVVGLDGIVYVSPADPSNFGFVTEAE
ncbi:MAG: septal ring lytic transglycosylase RlpA family protein [Cytophagales bacterium]|nr:septal ring lytic transglycosylase RlpA family protein [Cytophagales bacterium]